MMIASAARSALLVVGLACAAAAHAGKAEENLALFLSWFPGEYDNYEQAWQDSLDKVDQPHERIHHILEANGAFFDGAEENRGHAQKNQNISFNTIQPYPDEELEGMYPTILIQP